LFYFIGAILDPRFKKSWIKSSGFSESHVLEAVREELENKSRALSKKHFNFKIRLISLKVYVFTGARNNNSATPNLDEPKQVENVCLPPPSKRNQKSLYSTVINEPIRPNSASPSLVLDEFEVYINEKNMPMEEAVDPLKPEGPYKPVRPLEFWKQNHSRFPILGAISRDLFGIPASSGSIKRVLSTASDIMSAKRTRTKPDLLEKILFLKRNNKL